MSATPVLFLPGIMGSRLAWRDTRRAWDPDDKVAMLTWVKLGVAGGETLARALHYAAPADVMVAAPGITDAEAGRGWGGVVGSYYHSLFRAIEAKGHRVYSLGYDWRQDLRGPAGSLGPRLRDMRLDEEFILVTHSMGGLLARTMLTAQGDLPDRVRAVIHICQPCHGAPVLYRRMFTGCSSAYDGKSIFDRIFCQILGTSGEQFVTNVSAMPGALQLLPSWDYEFSDNKMGNWRGDRAQFVHHVYLHGTRPPGVIHQDASMSVAAEMRTGLKGVADFHDQVRVYHRATWFIFGRKLLTDAQLFHHDGEVATVRLPLGDGIVPESSAAPGAVKVVSLSEMAKAPRHHRYGYVDGMEHGMACVNERLIPDLVKLISHIQ